MSTGETLTIYKLINGYSDADGNQYSGRTIVIPKIQRDYAQGRISYTKKGEEDTSTKPYQVRIGLIEAFQKCLVDTQLDENGTIINCMHPIDLNFVYGKNENRDNKGIFIPIDGQQRLTALFLLHWYIFWRNDETSEIEKLGRMFSYESRDTTKMFCKELCDLNRWTKCDADNRIENLKKAIDQLRQNSKDATAKHEKNNHLLSMAIRNKVWFVSSYDSDPSVRSMLVMLDTIEERFIQFAQPQFSKFSKILKSDECQITFSHLGVENFDDKDMYIKMNARGKELTNFEIFKAKLEEKSDILKDVCYKEEQNKELMISDFIGKYNNCFTNLFYSKIGKADFDKAMFNFVQCMIKMDHFAHVSAKTKIDEKRYRDFISNYSYSGITLYNDYIAVPALHGYSGDNTNKYRTELQQLAKRSLVKTTNILDHLCKYDFADFPQYKDNENAQFSLLDSNKWETDFTIEERLFRQNKSDPSNILSVIQHALFSFLFEVDCSSNFDNAKRSAYKQWKRFVLNTMTLYNSKETANFAKMSGIYSTLLQEIRNTYAKSGKINETDVLTVIAGYNSYGLQDNMAIKSITFMFEREARKAMLMTGAQANEWKTIINEAESYYVDSDLDFLFAAVGDLDPQAFKACFEKSKKWFDKDKTPVNKVLLNEALLCMDYPAGNRTAHLYVIDRERWQFYYDSCLKNLRKMLDWPDEKQSREGIVSLLNKQQTQNEIDFYNDSISMETYVDELIKEYVPIKECELRNVLISYRVMSCIDKYRSKIQLSGTIGLWSGGTTSGQKEYILFKASRYNSANIELQSYILYCELIKDPAGANARIEWRSGTPRNVKWRYIQLGDKKVAYDVDIHKFINVSSGDQYDDVSAAKTFMLK